MHIFRKSSIENLSSESVNDKVFLLSYRAATNLPIGSNYSDYYKFVTFEEEIPSINELSENILTNKFKVSLSNIKTIKYDYENTFKYNSFYEDATEYYHIDSFSDYAVAKRQTGKYQKGILLRSPSKDKNYGFCFIKENHVEAYGNQFKNDTDDQIVQDIMPCIIIDLKKSEDLVKANIDFDF